MTNKCHHSFEEPTRRFRICLICGETQKEQLKTVQPNIQEWQWKKYPLDKWKEELLRVLEPVEVNREALEWYKKLKENS